jgi:hypothetical protein
VGEAGLSANAIAAGIECAQPQAEACGNPSRTPPNKAGHGGGFKQNLAESLY